MAFSDVYLVLKQAAENDDNLPECSKSSRRTTFYRFVDEVIIPMK